MATVKQYELITASIIKALKAGRIPWQKPWTGVDGKHRNALSDRGYNGLNPFTLWAVSIERGYESPLWLTFKQAQQLGGSVIKGQKATPGYIWKFDKVEVEKEDGTKELKTVPFLRISFVFNLEQTENVKLPKRRNQPEEAPKLEFKPLEQAQAIVDNYLANGGPSLAHNGGNRAFYSPSLDTIALPLREDFHSIDEYYSTAFHELGHSTGHKSRENRFPEDATLAAFGSGEYSKEELVAEFTSAFLADESGIDTTRENSTAYIQSWLRKLEDDPGLLVTAAGKAQRAANRILGTTAKDTK